MSVDTGPKERSVAVDQASFHMRSTHQRMQTTEDHCQRSNMSWESTHYDGVSSIKGCMNRSYFCNKCCKGYDHEDSAHHQRLVKRSTNGMRKHRTSDHVGGILFENDSRKWTIQKISMKTKATIIMASRENNSEPWGHLNRHRTWNRMKFG